MKEYSFLQEAGALSLNLSTAQRTARAAQARALLAKRSHMIANGTYNRDNLRKLRNLAYNPTRSVKVASDQATQKVGLWDKAKNFFLGNKEQPTFNNYKDSIKRGKEMADEITKHSFKKGGSGIELRNGMLQRSALLDKKFVPTTDKNKLIKIPAATPAVPTPAATQAVQQAAPARNANPFPLQQHTSPAATQAVQQAAPAASVATQAAQQFDNAATEFGGGINPLLIGAGGLAGVAALSNN